MPKIGRSPELSQVDRAARTRAALRLALAIVLVLAAAALCALSLVTLFVLRGFHEMAVSGGATPAVVAAGIAAWLVLGLLGPPIVLLLIAFLLWAKLRRLEHG